MILTKNPSGISVLFK